MSTADEKVSIHAPRAGRDSSILTYCLRTGKTSNAANQSIRGVLLFGFQRAAIACCL
jgi:hypothetical protein